MNELRAAKFLGIPFHEFLRLPDKRYLMAWAGACSQIEAEADVYERKQAQAAAKMGL